MVDPLIIKHSDIKVANADYESLFLKHGNILFELNIEENRELIHAVSQFEKYTGQEPDIDQREWIEENINPLPSLKPLAVFIFLITQWRATTIAGNAASPNDGYIRQHHYRRFRALKLPYKEFKSDSVILSPLLQRNAALA
tara:strand:+ start:1509 stop:1931 length:423 start_codon:yes stop_codon:yes gene_type:complete